MSRDGFFEAARAGAFEARAGAFAGIGRRTVLRRQLSKPTQSMRNRCRAAL